MLAVCALSGCTTFDRPFASSKLPAPARQDQRLQDDVNRRIQAGDYDGAKRLLDQADADKSGIPGRSHAHSDGAGDSGIQQVGYQSTIPSREDMIRELVKSEPSQRQAAEAQRYREMPISTLRQLYQNQQQAMSLGHQALNQRDVANNALPSGLAPVEAPNPRGGSFGGTTPWPTNSHESPGGSVATNPLNLPVPEATAPPAAATLAVTSTGVQLGGIQTGGVTPSASPVSATELPAINPAAPGSTLLPVIAPRRSTIPQTVAPSEATLPALSQAIEQVTGSWPASQTVNPTGGVSASPALTPHTNPQSTATTTAGSPASGSPATLPGTLEPLPRSTATSTPSNPGLDRFKPKIPNPLSGGMQKINQTTKNAFDRTLNLGFTPPPVTETPAMATSSNADASALLGALINQLETQLVAAAPGATDAEKLEHVRRHVNLRMLYLMAGQNDRAIEPIKGLEADEQEFWQHLLWSVANYFDAQGMPRASDRATQAVAELRTAAQKLKSQADLELRSVTFCQRIDSYGNFERLSRDQFPPGSAVLLYAEVENFGSMPAEGDRQMTSLKSTIEFFKSGSDKPIQTIPFKVTQDYCRTKRRDFYLAFEFSIPQQLEAGVYSLVLRTEDQVAKKVASQKINFSVE